LTQSIHAEIQHESSFQPLPTDEVIQTWVQAALKDRVPEETELCVRIVDKPEIQMLNQQYRNKNKPTNVLSFPIDVPEEVDVPLLGDIVICAPIVFEEAQAQNKTYEQHFAHMIVHGCLHLLGYDHETDEQADLMEPLEISILATIDIPNPYHRERS
jgi:probable rRNA maturation factor